MTSSLYDENNIFAQIIAGKIPAKKLYEDDQILAIHDINPVAPIHVLVLPKGHYIDYSDFIQKASAELIKHYFIKIDEIIQLLDLSTMGYRLITNKGSEAGQTIFHFHTHIIGGRQLVGRVGNL
ncbi:HIT domain-containing protein [Candidatus Trichorickettsia mobilis]|uniref:HIT domain-containing protein n=1 Tax=Candidatus Trichorickettsia mobilis TaxID=1346319 RepID=A0ABZ0UTZ8_9RICK|nr:HIT domain-containing protein [Candidatus Trichorickettsia mobilis]WPY00567.1 HIT domain-containing protein [Candidatus Trichorickettsia mobilis]